MCSISIFLKMEYNPAPTYRLNWFSLVNNFRSTAALETNAYLKSFKIEELGRDDLGSNNFQSKDYQFTSLVIDYAKNASVKHLNPKV